MFFIATLTPTIYAGLYNNTLSLYINMSIIDWKSIYTLLELNF
jgi:hypothetical protein